MSQYNQPPVRNVEFNRGLCDCFSNCGRCAYTYFCCPCAVADLSLAINPCCLENKTLRWWLLALFSTIILILEFSIGTRDQAGSAIVAAGWITGIVVVYNASRDIARRTGYLEEPCGCSCCCSYYWCWLCKLSQVASNLDPDVYGIQTPEVVELITEINEVTPIKNVLCSVDPAAARPQNAYAPNAQATPVVIVNQPADNSIRV